MAVLLTDPSSGIIYRHWRAPQAAPWGARLEPKGVLVLLHGLCAHSGRWEFFASFLAEKGFSSYALELRGFGSTAGPRGHADSFQNYFDDICRLLEIAKAENPAAKVFCAGESMGALVALLFALRYPLGIDGLICFSPAFESRLKFSPLIYLQFLFFLMVRRRRIFQMPLTPAMCTRDTAYQRQMEAEDRGRHPASVGLLFEILKGQARLKFLRARIGVPVLFLIAGMDSIVSPWASEKMFQRLAARDKEILRYPEMLHALSLDIGRENVFEDIAAWIMKKTEVSRQQTVDRRGMGEE